MRDNDAEALSALMDGEATELELRALVRDVARDPELAAKWSRYHLASAVMRKQLAPARPAAIGGLDLASRVSSALEEEPDSPGLSSPGSDAAGRSQRWRSMANIAVAASVAAAVVVGWEFARPGVPASAHLPHATASVQSVIQPGSTMPVGYRQSLPTPLQSPAHAYKHFPDTHVDDRFNRYLISHSGNAALATHGGAVSYVRVVTLKPAGAGTHP